MNTKWPFIDLRSSIDRRPAQAFQNNCGAVGLRAAIELAFDRSVTHRGVRVSGDFIWANAKSGGDVGATLWSYANAIASHGFVLEDDWSNNGDVWASPPPSVRALAARNRPAVFSPIPYIEDDVALSIYRRLQWGQAVVITFRATQNYRNQFGSYKTHQWDGSLATGGGYYEHIATVVGCDPSVGRFIVEDSAGEQYGDNGCYGFPIDKFLPGPQGCVTQLFYFEQLPVLPKKVESFMPAPATLTPAELAPFMEQMRAQWGAPLFEALGPNMSNYQGMIDRAVQLDYSDRMIEFAARWTRGFIVNFVASNPGSLDISRLRKEPLL